MSKNGVRWSLSYCFCLISSQRTHSLGISGLRFSVTLCLSMKSLRNAIITLPNRHFSEMKENNWEHKGKGGGCMCINREGVSQQLMRPSPCSELQTYFLLNYSNPNPPAYIVGQEFDTLTSLSFFYFIFHFKVGPITACFLWFYDS